MRFLVSLFFSKLALFFNFLFQGVLPDLAGFFISNGLFFSYSQHFLLPVLDVRFGVLV